MNNAEIGKAMVIKLDPVLPEYPIGSPYPCHLIFLLIRQWIFFFQASAILLLASTLLPSL